MVRTFIIALSVLFVFMAGAASSVAAQSAAHGRLARASVSSDALRLGIALPSHESNRAPDGYDCDASLQKRLAIGAVTGAIVGTAMYFAFTAIVPKGTGNRGRYATALIVPSTVLGALREAQYPSRLSCPHG